MPSLTARWQDVTGQRVEVARITTTFYGIDIDSVVQDTVTGAACRYAISADAGWRFRRFDIHDDGQGRTFCLATDGRGGWYDGDGEAVAGLAAAAEIDFILTPLTNSFPLHRLALAPGQSADIVTAWVSFPGLAVKPDPQRYTCLGPRRYRFESLDSDFSAEIDLDEHGLVTDYPGLFRRL